MIKLIVKEQKEGYSVSIRTKQSDLREHICALSEIYRSIKENDKNITDKQIMGAMIELYELNKKRKEEK